MLLEAKKPEVVSCSIVKHLPTSWSPTYFSCGQAVITSEEPTVPLLAQVVAGVWTKISDDLGSSFRLSLFGQRGAIAVHVIGCSRDQTDILPYICGPYGVGTRQRYDLDNIKHPARLG